MSRGPGQGGLILSPRETPRKVPVQELWLSTDADHCREATRSGVKVFKECPRDSWDCSRPFQVAGPQGQNYFHNNTNTLFAFFTSILSQLFGFPEATRQVIAQKTECRIQLLSIKAYIKEIYKKVKQCHFLKFYGKKGIFLKTTKTMCPFIELTNFLKFLSIQLLYGKCEQI